MSEKLAKIEVRLTETEKMNIKIYAARKGKTMSEIIRDLINKEIQEVER